VREIGTYIGALTARLVRIDRLRAQIEPGERVRGVRVRSDHVTVRVIQRLRLPDSEMGDDYHDRHIDPERRRRYLVQQLEQLGLHVAIQPAA
jgi:hypothetical protein